MTNKIKWGAVAWIAAAALLATWSGVAAGHNAQTSDRYDHQTAQLAKREHFYRVIAGKDSGEDPGPANRLARDLRDLSEDEVYNFEGDTNRYGGITEELGFDPFSGSRCDECGPLDNKLERDIALIKEGKLDAALQLHAVQPASHMDGAPVFIWVLWLLSFPTYAAVVVIREKRGEEARYRDFTNERELVGELREAAKGLPEAQRWETQHLADQLEAQIEERISYSKSKSTQMKLEHLTLEAQNAKEAIEAGNKQLT